MFLEAFLEVLYRLAAITMTKQLETLFNHDLIVTSIFIRAYLDMV